MQASRAILVCLFVSLALACGDATARRSKVKEFSNGITPAAGSFGVFGITAGPDGNVWFTESIGNKIGRITPAGSITEYQNSKGNAQPADITTGPDGNLWFTDNFGSIARVVITAAPVPAASLTTLAACAVLLLMIAIVRLERRGRRVSA